MNLKQAFLGKQRKFRTCGPDVYGEFRTTGSVNAAGDNLLLTAQGRLVVLSITIQPQAITTVQLKEGNVPMSGQWTLQAFQPWCAPGKVMAQFSNLVLNLGTAVVTSFEVRWARM